MTDCLQHHLISACLGAYKFRHRVKIEDWWDSVVEEDGIDRCQECQTIQCSRVWFAVGAFCYHLQVL